MPEIDSTYATIASLLPYDIMESKPGLNPKNYHIKKAPSRGFSLNVIPNDAFYMVNPDPLSDAKDVRFIKVPVPAMELAQSIVNDYVTSLLAVQPDAQPGFLVVKGNYTDIIKFGAQFAKELAEYRRIQNNWFKILVDIADDSWSRSRSPLGISDIQRYAAKELELKRDWITIIVDELTRCPFCQNTINPGAVKCMSCNEILDKKKYTELSGATK